MISQASQDVDEEKRSNESGSDNDKPEDDIEKDEGMNQETSTQLMRDMSKQTTVTYDDLNLLLFMTQRAISDLKHLKTYFFVLIPANQC